MDNIAGRFQILARGEPKHFDLLVAGAQSS